MNGQETMSNYEEKQMLSKKECEQYFEECEKTIRSIKLQAIEAIEKRDREIDELKEAKTQAIEAIEKKNRRIDDLEKRLKEEQEVVSQQIKEIKNKTDRIVLIEEELGVIKELKELIENKSNNELNLLRSELEAKKVELNKEQETHLQLKEDFKKQEEQYNKNREKWEKEREDFNEQIKVYEQIEAEKERIKTDLENLKEEIHHELYEQYCNLPSDFRETRCKSIDSSNLYNFIRTSAQDAAMSSLYGFIRDDTKERRDGTRALMEFFDSLFGAISKEKPSLKRLSVSRGDGFRDREMIKIGDGSPQGKVKEVIFEGCAKDGEVIFKSLVEVE